MVWDLGFLQIPIVKFHTVDGQNPAPPRMMIIPLFIKGSLDEKRPSYELLKMLKIQ